MASFLRLAHGLATTAGALSSEQGRNLGQLCNLLMILVTAVQEAVQKEMCVQRALLMSARKPSSWPSSLVLCV